MPLRKITVTEKNAKGKVISRRVRYVEASHGFVETTQGRDRGYGDARTAWRWIPGGTTRAPASLDVQKDRDERRERKQAEWRAREAELLKRIEALEGEVGELKSRVGALEDRPAGEGRDISGVSGELLRMRDRIAHMEMSTARKSRNWGGPWRGSATPRRHSRHGDRP